MSRRACVAGSSRRYLVMDKTTTHQHAVNVLPDRTMPSEGMVRSSGLVRSGHISSRTIRRTAACLLLAVGLAACGGSQTANEAAEDPLPSSTFLVAEIPEDEDEDTVPEALALVDPIGVDSPSSPPGAPPNHSILDDGQIFLRGTVPTAEISDLTVTAFEAILGEGNAIAEFTIDPSVGFDPDESQVIFLADAVLFESGSAEVTNDFADVLSFSPLLLEAHPNSTLWASGYTDSVGGVEFNLELSQDRVDSVRDWIIEQGGDPERIFATGWGEDQPVADNSTEQGRAQNRRVEFIVDNFDIGI